MSSGEVIEAISSGTGLMSDISDIIDSYAFTGKDILYHYWINLRPYYALCDDKNCHRMHMFKRCRIHMLRGIRCDGCDEWKKISGQIW